MKTFKMIGMTLGLVAVLWMGSQALAFDRGDYRPAVYVQGNSGGDDLRSAIQPAHYYGRPYYGHRYYGRPYRGYRPYYGGGGYYGPYSYGYPSYYYPRPYYYGYPFFGLSIGVPPLNFHFGF